MKCSESRMRLSDREQRARREHGAEGELEQAEGRFDKHFRLHASWDNDMKP